MLKAKEIMVTEVMTVNEDCPLSDAIRVLVENRITGLPVVNSANELVGMVSEKDILSLAYRMIANPAQGDDGRQVTQMMSKEVVSFGPETNLADICQCFIGHSFRRVPIVEDGKLVGLISRRDIVSHAFKVTCQSGC